MTEDDADGFNDNSDQRVTTTVYLYYSHGEFFYFWKVLGGRRLLSTTVNRVLRPLVRAKVLLQTSIIKLTIFSSERAYSKRFSVKRSRWRKSINYHFVILKELLIGVI